MTNDHSCPSVSLFIVRVGQMMHCLNPYILLARGVPIFGGEMGPGGGSERSRERDEGRKRERREGR